MHNIPGKEEDRGSNGGSAPQNLFHVQSQTRSKILFHYLFQDKPTDMQNRSVHILVVNKC